MNALMETARNMLNNWEIHVLLWLIVLDIFTGMAKSFSRTAKVKTNSTKGLTGLIKHLLVIVVVLVAYPYLDVLGFTSVGNAILIFYIATYGISVTENWGQLGLPIPSFIKERFEKLKEDSEKEIK